MKNIRQDPLLFCDDQNKRERVPCPICGNIVQDINQIRASIGSFQLSIGECQECHIALQTPRPTKKESMDYINWRFTSTDPGDIYVTDRQYKKQVSLERLKWINTLTLPNNKLLDIGAGNGGFCAAAIDCGYDAIGTETSIQATRRAKEMFNIDLINGDIDSISQSSKFGIITMWDVIEHLRDPLGMLLELRKRLEDGGLIIVETGNYECLSRLVQGEKWGLYLFDHMYYFSPESLNKLFKIAGFKDFRIHRSLFGGSNAVSPTLNISSIIQKLYQLKKLPYLLIRLPYASYIARTKYQNHWDLNLLVATARK